MSTENKNMPAFPTLDHNDGRPYEYGGLTKREYIAAIAMQGMLTNVTYIETSVSALAESAIQYADELLNQLNQ